ncbi:RNA-binding motif protein, X-linked 2-like [Myxocyprinus asiaticus]|uniref:RNA-binding motif protein, X-linked 2-like n=1 Tax=Myxocyprinus asiaticus TaxID=70543 RepID=UPI00222291CB|nr:RNA-binding motif protein, X-linked 2-like [Myxocyprinus asiaticus]
MNPLTKVKLINELNEREAELGVKDNVSWHSVYKDSAWIFIGGFPYELTEGDIICVFSQYGEIANINLVRDKKTGKSKGFCFLCYEDQRSTILAVDNFNGIKIKGRTIRVDHVANYRPPKDTDDIDDITEQLRKEGCAPKVPPPSSESESEEDCAVLLKKPKKDKKEKKKKKKKEKKKALKVEKHQARTEMSTSFPVKVKKEKKDEVYEKYAIKGPAENRRDRPGQEARGHPQYREEELERFRDRHRDDRRVERDRDKEGGRRIDQSREEKRQDNTQQRYNRDKGRGSDRERNGDGGRDRERERDRDRDKGRERDRHRDRSREGEHRRN